MASSFENFINAELPARVVLIKGADAIGDPRNASNVLVTNAPTGTLYLQDDVEPKVTWQKQGAAASKWVVISGSFGKIPIQRKLIVSSAFPASESINLTTGVGATGTATCSGDSITIPTDYVTNKSISFYLNGLHLEKGVQVIHSSGSITINIPLDPLDRIIVNSEADI